MEDRRQAMAHQSTTEATALLNRAVITTTRDSDRTERRPTCRDLPTCRRRRRLPCLQGHPWADQREEEGRRGIASLSGVSSMGWRTAGSKRSSRCVHSLSHTLSAAHCLGLLK